MTEVNVHFDNIRDEILSTLDKAETSIKVCMAWLTDKVLMQKLLDKLSQGLDVEICLLDHEFNKIKLPIKYGNSLDNLNNYWADLKSFQSKNGKLNIVPKQLGFIHHKFAIIDQKITITGSYNWSVNAISNMENIVIIKDPIIAGKFLAHLEQIVSVNHSHIISNNFNTCNTNHCGGRILKIKIIDFRSTTKYSQNDTYSIGICTEDMNHIETISDNIETNYLADLIEYEYEQLEGELEGKIIKHKEAIYKRRIESRIAWSLDSRLDVFVEQNSHDILGVYKIVKDIDGDDELKAIWEHELIKPYFIEGWENEIIEHIDNI